MALLLSVFEQGLIYGVMALGVYITYKILDFPDLTVDGSFPMGAAIAAVMISGGAHPLLTLPASFGAGVLAGALTGVVHVTCKVRDLLSGIIMMTALYTVNLRITGKANVPLYNKNTVFENKAAESLFGGALAPFRTLILIAVIAFGAKYLLDWYLGTHSGYLLRAVGDNSTFVTSMGVDKGKVKIIGLAISNGLVALGGCLFAQQQRFFDISMGTGTVVIGLASVIIGTSLLKKLTLFHVTTSVMAGSILYKACVAFALRYMKALNLQSKDLKLVTSVLFLLILLMAQERRKKVKANA